MQAGLTVAGTRVSHRLICRAVLSFGRVGEYTGDNKLRRVEGDTVCIPALGDPFGDLVLKVFQSGSRVDFAGYQRLKLSSVMPPNDLLGATVSQALSI